MACVSYWYSMPTLSRDVKSFGTACTPLLPPSSPFHPQADGAMAATLVECARTESNVVSLMPDRSFCGPARPCKQTSTPDTQTRCSFDDTQWAVSYLFRTCTVADRENSAQARLHHSLASQTPDPSTRATTRIGHAFRAGWRSSLRRMTKTASITFR